MKNILILHHFAEPPGGNWVGTHDTYKCISEKYNIAIISSVISHYSMDRINNEKKILADGIKYYFVETSKYKNNGIMRIYGFINYMLNSYFLAVNQLDHVPDVVIACTPHPLTLLSAFFLSRKYSTKFVIELHDLWPEYVKDVFKPKIISSIFSYLLKKFEFYFLLKADKVFTLWPGMREYLLLNGLDESKILHIPLMVNEELYRSSKMKRLMGLGSNDKNFINIVITARLGQASNVEDFFKILKYIKFHLNSDLKIICNVYGDGEKREFLEKFIVDNEMKNEVIFHGMKTKGEISDALAKSDIAVASLPDVRHYNLYGPIPTKVIDYLQYSIPLIFISNVIDENNILKRMNSWIACKPNDPKLSALYILKFMNDYHKLLPIEFEKTEKYLKKYHFSNSIASQIESAIDNILDK